MLRDYQIEMISRLHDAWLKHRHVMVQMPTGTGKTHVMAQIVRHELTMDNGQLTIGGTLSKSFKGGDTDGVLIVAHRRELIEQISETLGAFGIEHGVIVSGKTVDMSKRVQVASIQTLHRMEPPSYPPKGGRLEGRTTKDVGELSFGLVVIDEAHHAQARTYRELWDRWPEAKFLGLTATPCRMSGEGFKDLFDVLLQSCPISWFIERGWLSDFEYVSARPDSLMMQQVGRLTKRGADGDYQTKEMALVMDNEESIEHLYATYKTYVRGKKGIVYAIDKAHAEHISQYYSRHGIKSCWIESGTPAAERRNMVEAYRRNEIDVIVNVDIFSEGFDCPEVEFIQLARPTLSLSKYLQQVGRGMRRSSGKDCVIILDQVGLYQTFGLPTDNRDWHGMYDGTVRGMGLGSDVVRLVVDSERDSKTLLNADMVHIKRRGERHTGLEIFLQNGRYGVMKDGAVTCNALFVDMKPLQPPYYVLATYPYEVYGSRKTIIDNTGRDVNACLFGGVKQDGDFFMATDRDGRTMWYDGQGGRMYAERPTYEQLGEFDVFRSADGYMLRKSMPMLNFKFTRNEVLLGSKYSIFKNVLLLNNQYGNTYRVLGYEQGEVVVATDGYPYAKAVRPDGSMHTSYAMVSRIRKTFPSSLKKYGLRRV